MSLYLSQVFYTHLRDQDGALRDRLWPAIIKAANRELQTVDGSGKVSIKGNSRISTSGERLFGVTKSVDGRSLSLALLYYADLSQDPSVKTTAISAARSYHMLAH